MVLITADSVAFVLLCGKVTKSGGEKIISIKSALAALGSCGVFENRIWLVKVIVTKGFNLIGVN